VLGPELAPRPGELEDGDHLVVGVAEPGDQDLAEIGDAALVGLERVARSHDLERDSAGTQVVHGCRQVVALEGSQRPGGLARVVGALEQEEAGVAAGSQGAAARAGSPSSPSVSS
jgi:hypothetical protein